MSILLYLLFNKKSDKKIVKKKHIFDLKTFKRKSEIYSCTNSKKVCVKDSKNMVWTDDEVQPLLETVISFKSKKSYEGIDWESVKEKYELSQRKINFLKHFYQKISQDFMESRFLHEKRLQQK